MVGTSISSQLQSLKSFIQTDNSNPLRRPFTRPSILFDPKQAADIDIETILNIAIEGLDVLITIDERFRNYKSNLFSIKSKDLDRELMTKEENNQMNGSISSYLRLLSAHFQIAASLKSLEYLVRRYKIHVYNAEEMILCALPYHDTHAFVRIVQLIELRNSRWKFLDGVKTSGAPPPRKVIVQQCISDKGVLEVLCNYASLSKKFQPPKQVISFCTAVIVETLGSVVTIGDDLVKRVLPFVIASLQPGIKGWSDHKAGGLMIIGLLASRVTLAPKLVNNLIRTVAEVTHEAAKDLSDLQWLRLSLICLINLVQSQTVNILPKKGLDLLKEIRDLSVVLLGLSKDFNIDKFLSVLLDSLVDYSSSDEQCRMVLVSILERVPVKYFVDRLVLKILKACLKMSEKSDSASSGGWTKDLFLVINKNYPSELHGAVCKFLKDEKVQSKKGDSNYSILSKMLDWDLGSSSGALYSKVWLGLNHPRAEVRCATLAGLTSSGTLRSLTAESQSLVDIQEAILRQLHDDDLTVIQAALSIDGLPEVINSNDLLEALCNVLNRSIENLVFGRHGSSVNNRKSCDVAVASLTTAIACFHSHVDYSKKVVAMMFPLLLILPKTQRLNLKALELAKKINWPLYQNLPSVPTAEEMLKSGAVSSVNLKTINSFAKTFISHPEEYVLWFAERCHDSELSKTQSLLVLMQSFSLQSNSDQFFALFESSFLILKTEWNSYLSSSKVSLEEFNSEMLDWDCNRFVDHLVDLNLFDFNAKVLVCALWKLLSVLISAVPADAMRDQSGKWADKIQELFIFFATSQCKNVFKDHIHYLVTQGKVSPVCFLSKFFREEGVSLPLQVASLKCFASLCRQSQERWPMQLLAEFPSILVPLASDNMDVKGAAVNCIEALHVLWTHAGKKNGNNVAWTNFLGEILGLMDQHKRLILSDKNFLASLISSLLGSSSHNFLMPQNIENRFDPPTKEKILTFLLGSALKFSDYGKLIILCLLKGIQDIIIRIKEVESLLSLLLRRRREYNRLVDNSCNKLSDNETKILCLLLESCILPSSDGGNLFGDHIIEALQLDEFAQGDPVLIQPCITVLNTLNGEFYSGLRIELKEHLIKQLVLLLRNTNGDVHNATREALLRLEIDCSTIIQMLHSIFMQRNVLSSSSQGKKKIKLSVFKESELHDNAMAKIEDPLRFLSSLIDVLLLKKNMVNRDLLIGPLFKALSKVFSDEWVSGALSHDQSPIQVSSTSDVKFSVIVHIQQTLLIIIKDIIMSLQIDASLKDNVKHEVDVHMLVDCARCSKDAVTRNHAFSVISSISRIYPEKVLEYTLDIFSALGESAVTQVDNYSKMVFEDLISAIAPCWLSNTDNVTNLLEIFMKILPEVAEHRRLSLVIYLLRSLGECKSLSSLLCLLFQSVASRQGAIFLKDIWASDAFVTHIQREWEYVFAVQLCGQYTPRTWLPGLIMLLQQIGSNIVFHELFLLVFIAMKFTWHKLQDPEFAFKHKVGDDFDSIQKGLRELMEQVFFLLQLVEARKKELSVPFKKVIKEHAHATLRIAVTVMTPSSYFTSIVNLLGHCDRNIRKKALGHLCETARAHSASTIKHRGKKVPVTESMLLHVDEHSRESFNKMCLEINRIIDISLDDSHISLKVAAVSALEALAKRFPSDDSIYCLCLASVTKHVNISDLALTCSCLRTISALINVLGPKALVELPHIMDNIIRLSRGLSSESSLNGKIYDLDESVLLDLLSVLEAVVDKLGGFISPYLTDVMEILLLHPKCVSELDSRVKLKAQAVRMLLTEKIPVRLILHPFLNGYCKVVQSGDLSVATMFDMLKMLVKTMDRSSIAGYHGKIYEQCLNALDLRHQHPVSILNVDFVERHVIDAVVTLTMKLTESLFKPLFIRSIEWVGFDSNEAASVGYLDRAISFYSLINKLAESHRSLFVPYFKYLLDGCILHLSADREAKASVSVRKKKKAKVQEEDLTKEGSTVSIKQWHIRTLVLSSLHKCFLYDSGNLKFLDSSNFQRLLKPIVATLVVEPPAYLEENMNVPTEREVDDLLVTCLGQMAVTAGTDLLWKQLNHEVLMQTRSEKVRARILGLRIIKYLVENLKEEYLVFVAETIPFLAELLEDAELIVKSLAQEILKEMECLSGESLEQYF